MTEPSAAAGLETLSVGEFARLFGISPTSMPAPCLDLIWRFDFSYRVLQGPDHDATLLRALKTLEQSLEVSGPHRIARWEEGWGENLRLYLDSGGDLEELLPGYYRRGATPMRLFGRYILPANPRFEACVLKVLQTWIACDYLAEVDDISEIGCGPAHNLVAFASLYPEKSYQGFDWAEASQKVIHEITRREHFKLNGRNFDMFRPDMKLRTPKGGALLTIGAMEQLGQRYHPFLEWLLSQDAALYLHIEPILELHDQNSLLGYLGAQYMRKRGYLDGYLNALRALERDGAIRIEKAHTLIGSANYDGWNLVVWRKPDWSRR